MAEYAEHPAFLVHFIEEKRSFRNLIRGFLSQGEMLSYLFGTDGKCPLLFFIPFFRVFTRLEPIMLKRNKPRLILT